MRRRYRANAKQLAFPMFYLLWLLLLLLWVILLLRSH
jgi:hypothetical protein